MSPRDTALAVAVMAVFGSNFVASKLALAAFPPLFLLALRFFAVAVVLVPLVRVPRGRLWRIFGLSVLMGGVHFPMMFVGLDGLDAATAVIAIQLQVPFSAVLAAIVYRERLGVRRVIAMIAAIAGVAIIAGEPRLEGAYGALMLVIGASLAFAATPLQVKAIGPISPLTLSGWVALFATPQLIGLSLVLEQGQAAALAAAAWADWAALGYIVVLVSILGHSIWNRLVAYYPVNQTMPFLLTVPVFGVAAGVFILGDVLTMNFVFGGLLTIAGVAVIVLPGPDAVTFGGGGARGAPRLGRIKTAGKGAPTASRRGAG